MKQWTTLMDGIAELQLFDVPEPVELGKDEVLVKISRVSLNYRDIKLISGDFKGRYSVPSHPIVPISDASGTVVRVSGDAASEKWKVGDRVFNVVRPAHQTGPTRAEHHASGIGIPQPGVLSEYRVFSASGLVAVPEYMTLDEASTLPIAAITAWMALNWDRPVGQPRTGSNITVLLQGTGGVSISALQQANALGLTTIVTSSSDEKLQKVKSFGATHTINYVKVKDWADEVLRITGGKGADVVIETGGPATMEQSLKAVAEGGNINAVGILTGSTDSNTRTAIGLSLINRNATLKGINIGPRDRMEEVVQFYAAKQIHPIIGQTFKFEEAKEAMECMKQGSNFGKVVICVD